MFDYNNCPIVVWGHKDVYHTHGHIHEGIYRALLFMGRDAHWLDLSDNVCPDDFKNVMFFTERQAVPGMPINGSNRYVVHNLSGDWGAEGNLIPECTINFGVFVRPHEGATFIEPFFPVYENGFEMIWATDALPPEIDNYKRDAKPLNMSSKIVNWIGTNCYGGYGNMPEISEFNRAAGQCGIKMEFHGGFGRQRIPVQENARLVRESYMAPALQGRWQIGAHYIPCRIFKNISYGCGGVTNSKAVADLFEGQLIYHQSAYDLFYLAEERLRKMPQTSLHQLMDFVKERHTYINRINSMLKALELIENRRSK